MIHAVQKAMKILSVLSDTPSQPVPLMDIAQRTGYPKPTCSHILETLCHDGYVVRVSQTKGYLPGPALYCLTRYGRYEEELVSLCRPVMRWMERTSHATVILSVIRNGQKFIIDYADTEQQMLSDHFRIRLDDIYRTATGRVILSHMSLNEIREIYEKHGPPNSEQWPQVTDLDSLLGQLEPLRTQTIVSTGIENGLVIHQNIAFASPLFRGKTCVGAIGLAWRVSEKNVPLPREVESLLITTLKKGTQEIKRRLCYEPPISGKA